MRNELIGHYIMNKVVGIGETAYSILCLREGSSGPLKLELKN
ncbi:hypothetical protein [Rufibacter roseus]